MEKPDDVRARREAIVLEHVAAENRHDLDAVLATFRRPHYEIVPAGEVNDGPDAVRQMLSGLIAGFPDYRVEILSMRHADDAVVLETKATGTHDGVWAGAPPTGRTMSVRMAAFFLFEGAELIGEKLYFDIGTIVRQLGLA